MSKDYFIGLDIGTDSVGFAVTDDEYNVIKKSKKSLIGTRLFESGNTAEERRSFRSARRRIARNKQRIEFLRSLFSEEICKTDQSFFMRLDESIYHKEDKSTNQKNSLFDDLNFIDKSYFAKYPTIFHLRKALINGEVTDIRLLYLGLAHIIKSRGHFLFAGQDFGSIQDFKVVFNELNELFEDEEYAEFRLPITDINRLEDILKTRSNGIIYKTKEIEKLLSLKPSKAQKAIIKLISGGKTSLGDIFEDVDDEFKKKSITFSGDFDAIRGEIEPVLVDDMIVIEKLKTIYDWSILCDILSGYSNLADAKIATFETHKKDLGTLKEIVKEYIFDDYKEIFEAPNQKANYPAYIGMTKIKGKKQPLQNGICSQEDFCKFVLGKLKSLEIDEKYSEILAKLENSTLLPKQKTKDNSVIPYQVHLAELELILKNSAKNFPFLQNSDGENTIADKIKSIFMYRIPYFVGPLNNHSSFAWIVKNLEEKVTPWNFEKVVNLEESAERFIKRMTNKCTYLKDCDVIPKKSLLYSKYEVLNELNNLKLDGNEISVLLKQEIFEGVFKKNKKVSQATLKKYLKSKSYDKDVKITGIDGNFKSSLDSYISFGAIFGENFDEEMAENIIKWITLFSDDKKMLQNKIQQEYSTITKEQLQRVCKLKFSGWGRFSKEFLTEVDGFVYEETGEYLNIIEALYQSNNNLMQLLSKENEFIEKINAIKTTKDDIKLQDIKDLYCSPAVKKSIWQSVQIVKEIEKIMGYKPTKLFIEVTRGEGEKKATTSRHRDLLYKYNAFKKEYAEIYTQLSGKTESDLRQKKLYLYFTQLGKCAYTGKTIHLEDLNNQNLWDIDHIFPRSKTKDDSIHNNLVLVDKTANAKKTDKYPIPNEYRQTSLWKLWLDKGLINETKYNRLMRNTEFEDRELEGFIARQLVETSQSSKAVAELFEGYFANAKAKNGEKSKVVYVKAGNVSDFRKHFDIVKVRDLNDYHHAHDAYLNIVVGNVWDTRFTKNFFQNIKNETFNIKPEKLYKYNTKKGDYFAWKGESENNESLKTVKNVVENSPILFTRQSYTKTGTLFKIQPIKKGVKNVNAIPLKGSDEKLHNFEKYGSYTGNEKSHFSLVEYKKGKKIVRELISIPIYLYLISDKYPEKLNEYICRETKSTEYKILIEKVKINSFVKVDGAYYHLSGGSDVKNAMQLTLPKKYHAYLKKIAKFIKQNYISEADIITLETNLEIYNLLSEKLILTIFAKVNRHSVLGNFIKEQTEIFKSLELFDQIKALNQILTIFACRAGKADLRIIKGTERTNRLNTSLIVTNHQEFKLINQSITGFYEYSIDLLK